MSHPPPQEWQTAPVPSSIPRGPLAKWQMLYNAVKTNSEIPLATVIPLDKKRPRQQVFALRRALGRRAVREGFLFHVNRRDGRLYLWLTLPAPEEAPEPAQEPA